MTVEERLKMLLGELMVANQANLARIEELEKKIKEFETKISKEVSKEVSKLV